MLSLFRTLRLPASRRKAWHYRSPCIASDRHGVGILGVTILDMRPFYLASFQVPATMNANTGYLPPSTHMCLTILSYMGAGQLALPFILLLPAVLCQEAPVAGRLAVWAATIDGPLLDPIEGDVIVAVADH